MQNLTQVGQTYQLEIAKKISLVFWHMLDNLPVKFKQHYIISPLK